MTTNVINAARAAADLMTDANVQKAQAVIESAQGKAAHAVLKALGMKIGERPKPEIVAELKAAFIGPAKIVLDGEKKDRVEQFGTYVLAIAEKNKGRAYWVIEESKTKGQVMRLTVDGESAHESARTRWSEILKALEWRAERTPGGGRPARVYLCPCCNERLNFEGEGKDRTLVKAPPAKAPTDA
jgi:hypothetical protein